MNIAPPSLPGARWREIGVTNLIGEKDRTHAAGAQAADNAETPGQSRGKQGCGFRGLGDQAGAIARTERHVV